MSRPEVLFPLFADLTGLDGVGPKTAQLFARMEVSKPADLVLTLPSGGVDRRLRGLAR
jgi:ATP-dependent DNA helicase RecG